MDKKDEIILRQWETIRSMTEHNLRRMYTDFWPGQNTPPRTDTGTKPNDVPDTEKNGVMNHPVPEKNGVVNRPASEKKSVTDNPAAPEKNSVVNHTAPEKNSVVNHTAPEKNSVVNHTVPEKDTAAGDQAGEELPVESMEDLKAELDGYIGLENVKQEVRSLVNLVEIHKLRREHHLPAQELSLHMVFTGNPGTGKTTIARLMARIYHSLGILKKGQLVEVDRGGLVAGYIGQTAVKTAKVIDSAAGGVLFIDEAYALSGRGENDFGQEAIDTLLKAMEDRRDEFIVIAAGYDSLMDRFIHSNPGLESRFNRFLHFDDYTSDELLKIFRIQCERGGYTLSDDAEKAVRERIEQENGPTFANARGIRNLFEKTLVRQANRLAGMEHISREQLMEITPEDIQNGKTSEDIRDSKTAGAPEDSTNDSTPAGHTTDSQDDSTD